MQETDITDAMKQADETMAKASEMLKETPKKHGRPEHLSRPVPPSKHVKGRSTYENKSVWTTPTDKTLNSVVVAMKLQNLKPLAIAKATRLDPREIERIWTRFQRLYMKALTKAAETDSQAAEIAAANGYEPRGEEIS